MLFKTFETSCFLSHLRQRAFQVILDSVLCKTIDTSRVLRHLKAHTFLKKIIESSYFVRCRDIPGVYEDAVMFWFKN